MSPNGMPCIGSSSSKTAPKPDAETDSQFRAAVAIAAPLAAVPDSVSKNWKKDSRVLSLHPLWHSPKPEAQPDSKFLEAAPYTAAVVAPVASCQLPMLSSATVKYACNEVTT